MVGTNAQHPRAWGTGRPALVLVILGDLRTLSSWWQSTFGPALLVPIGGLVA